MCFPPGKSNHGGCEILKSMAVDFCLTTKRQKWTQSINPSQVDPPRCDVRYADGPFHIYNTTVPRGEISCELKISRASHQLSLFVASDGVPNMMGVSHPCLTSYAQADSFISVTEFRLCPPWTTKGVGSSVTLYRFFIVQLIWEIFRLIKL